jgi:hypothetical protein
MNDGRAFALKLEPMSDENAKLTDAPEVQREPDHIARAVEPDQTVTLTLPDKQIQLLLDALTPKKDHGFPFDRLLQLLQVVSIMTAAAWTLYNYLAFEREEKTLAAQVQRVNRDQQELTLKQNQLTAANQRALTEVTLKQQEFSLEQQRLLANTTQQKAQLDIRALELANSLKGIEVASQTQTPLKYQVKLKLERSKSSEPDKAFGRWQGLLYIYVQNVSKKIIFINSAKIDQYIGEASEPQDQIYIRRFNPPDENAGPIKWTLTSTTGYYSIQRSQELFGSSVNNGKGWSLGGPAFGRLERDEGSTYTPTYQIRAKQHSIVGFIVSLSVEQDRKPWVWQMVLTRSTEDTEPDVVESVQQSGK